MHTNPYSSPKKGSDPLKQKTYEETNQIPSPLNKQIAFQNQPPLLFPLGFLWLKTTKKRPPKLKKSIRNKVGKNPTGRQPGPEASRRLHGGEDVRRRLLWTSLAGMAAQQQMGTGALWRFWLGEVEEVELFGGVLGLFCCVWFGVGLV